MRLEFLGHACFRITFSSGRTLVLDPYEPNGLGGRLTYQPVPTLADWVFLSHEHADHADTSWLDGDPAVLRSGFSCPDFDLAIEIAAHDEFGGNLRGGHVRIATIDAEGVRLVHCGDLGERLTAERLAEWGHVDVLLVPTGGYFTLGPDGAAELGHSSGAHTIVPYHYRTAAADIEQLLPVNAFLRRFPEGMVRRQDAMHLGAGAPVTETGEVVVLRPLGLGVQGGS